MRWAIFVRPRLPAQELDFELLFEAASIRHDRSVSWHLQQGVKMGESGRRHEHELPAMVMALEALARTHSKVTLKLQELIDTQFAPRPCIEKGAQFG
jgi:hypothetical protein